MPDHLLAACRACKRARPNPKLTYCGDGQHQVVHACGASGPKRAGMHAAGLAWNDLMRPAGDATRRVLSSIAEAGFDLEEFVDVRQESGPFVLIRGSDLAAALGENGMEVEEA